MTGGVGDGVEDGDGRTAAGVGGGRRIKGPGAGALDSLVGHAGDGGRSVIFHRHLLAALGGVATGIGGPPGAGGIEGVAAVTSEVGHGAEDGQGYVAARVARRGRIEGPGAGALDDLVGYAGDGRRGVVFYRHLLAAVGRVAAGIGRPPGAGGIESVAAVAGEVGDGGKDADGHAPTRVGGGGRIKGPGAGALDDFVRHAGDGWRGVIFHR